jgi:hypothetical protein
MSGERIIQGLEEAINLARNRGWRPIETVPTPTDRDTASEWIIGYTAWGQHVGKLHEHVGPCEWFADSKHPKGGTWEFRNHDFDVFPEPSQWMPWPQPPRAP